jgi:surfeit locus 1 family protein
VRDLRFWVVTLAAIAGGAATFSLGVWQWGRAQQKLALEARIEARAALPPAETADLRGAELSALLHRRVVLRGHWEPRHTVFLDNRQMEGRQGFYVLTPLRLAGGPPEAAVLVQRGWVPRDFSDRTRLPAVDTPAGEVTVLGRLAPPPAKLYELGAGQVGTIRQNLDLAQFRAETGLPLVPLSVQQLAPPSEGLLRAWPKVAGTAGKNYGYAFQWWALSALIAVLYVWFQFIAPRRTRPS